MRLDGKVVLVTGATSGIGWAIARRAHTEGACTVVHGLEAEPPPGVADRLGERLAYLPGDLRDPDVPDRLVAATVERYGRLDGLVNNAARTDRSTLHTASASLFDELMAVNVRAPMLLVQALLAHVRTRRDATAGTGTRVSGVVVNVGSVNAYCGEPNLLIYSATKGALMTLTRNLADAHARDGLRVVQINPGWTLTEAEDRIQQAGGQAPGWEADLPPAFAPFGRIFRPEEIAAHVAFWLSDEGGPVTGAVVDLTQFPVVGRNPNKHH